MQNGSAVETAEITVQFVNDPKPGKRWGSIKDTAGNYYGGPPAMLSQFRPGETCKIEYTLGGNDGTLKGIKRKVEVPKALQKALPAAPRASTNPKDSERMGAMGMVNAFIHTGAVELQRDAIKAAIVTCRDAYNDVWGSPKKREVEAEFNDEIPY